LKKKQHRAIIEGGVGKKTGITMEKRRWCGFKCHKSLVLTASKGKISEHSEIVIGKKEGTQQRIVLLKEI